MPRSVLAPERYGGIGRNKSIFSLKRVDCATRCLYYTNIVSITATSGGNNGAGIDYREARIERTLSEANREEPPVDGDTVEVGFGGRSRLVTQVTPLPHIGVKTRTREKTPYTVIKRAAVTSVTNTFGTTS